jgi:predicted RNA-binding protein with PIN domain
MRIVIDGYNLLKAIPDCRALEMGDPEAARDHLIACLGRYRWLKGHQVVVVFDGWLAGQPLQRRTNARGVQVIYSPRGEQADEVIRRGASQVAHQGIVVTSDRALANDMRQRGVEVISSAEFGERLRRALSGSGQGDADEPDEESTAQRRPLSKAGRSRRRSRAARRREGRWRNL